ncbi:hypothetical protein GUJ93_ZPchr0007g5222 [Zizania palustris]|uniref:Hexosyltransferase n=1 Tax=Zizania palustris TaxID=103762 RepID=A0A8J5T3B4_ZIZPA|nr:hypothetical protein GUJ93_ZPchr0007g5222 [Zizania palustris]
MVFFFCWGHWLHNLIVCGCVELSGFHEGVEERTHGGQPVESRGGGGGAGFDGRPLDGDRHHAGVLRSARHGSCGAQDNGNGINMHANARAGNLYPSILIGNNLEQLLKMDRKVKSSRIRALFNRHLASLGIPKSMHCLALRLAEEFAVSSAARSPVPLPEHAPRLTDAAFLHVALVTDNVLAAAVAVASAVRSSADPARLVFHVVTDKKSYVPMHSWFALHPVSPAVVEVKGLHQFDWRDAGVIASVMRTIEEVQRTTLDYHQRDDGSVLREYRRLEASKPSTFSLLNYLKIHLPEFFPELGRVLLLDDDVVVRKDLTRLWEKDLGENIIGVVGAHGPGRDGAAICIEKTLGDHLNFTDPEVSTPSLGLQSSRCAWSWGVSIVDLDAWRRTNVTETYQLWLEKNRESGFRLWKTGSLPPALIAFDGRVQAVEPLWHLPGLGWRMPDADLLRRSAVLHFSGPRKPWLEVAFPELRELWLGHLNGSDSFLQGCGVV